MAYDDGQGQLDELDPNTSQHIFQTVKTKVSQVFSEICWQLKW